MMVKPGDQVWVRVTVAEVFGERFMIEELHCQNGEHLPDSPALATVAAWLTENPQAHERLEWLRGMWNGAMTGQTFTTTDQQMGDVYETLNALVSALTPTHGASDD